jgi:hypothetical protein
MCISITHVVEKEDLQPYFGPQLSAAGFMKYGAVKLASISSKLTSTDVFQSLTSRAKHPGVNQF